MPRPVAIIGEWLARSTTALDGISSVARHRQKRSLARLCQLTPLRLPALLGWISQLVRLAVRRLGSVTQRFILAFGAANALVLATAIAEDGNVRAALEARYNAMKSAMAARNGGAIVAMLTPDFSSVDVSGRSESGPEMIEEVSHLPPDPNKVSATTLISVAEAQNTATVEQRYDMHTVRVAADGSAHNIELITLSTDTWVSNHGTWLLARTVTNEMTLYRDGQITIHRVKQ